MEQLILIRLQENELNNKRSREVLELINKGYPKVFESDAGEYNELFGYGLGAKPAYLITHNQQVSQTLHADYLNGEGVDLEGMGRITGQSIIIGLWDNGRPRPYHELLRKQNGTGYLSRIEYVTNPLQNTTIQRHATHVAGTMIGFQVNPTQSTQHLEYLVRGIAYESRIKAWDWLNIESEFVDAVNDGILVGNTSFGFNPVYLHQAEFGRYNLTAQSWDAVMCAAPYFQIVKSVGNARDDFDGNGLPMYPQVTAKGGYDLLEGAGVSKNVLVVGSVNLVYDDLLYRIPPYILSEIDEDYSSWGGTDDGRIKPDFVVHGNLVLSSTEQQNNSYLNYTGTSQSAAGLTGGIALLQELWNKKFRNQYMQSSTVRALLVHSTDDILPDISTRDSQISDGPDYRHGWGVPNLQKATDLILNQAKSTMIREEILPDGQTHHYTLAANGFDPLVITLAWTDPSGEVVPVDLINPNSSIDEQAKKLINDLDIRVYRKDPQNPTNYINSDLLLPWKLLDNGIIGLGEDLLSQPAQRGDNSIDNVEKIEVPTSNFSSDIAAIPQGGGIYYLEVTHKNTLSPTCNPLGQSYSLIVSGVSFCTHSIEFFQHEDDIIVENVNIKCGQMKAYNIIDLVGGYVEFEAADFLEFLPQQRNGESGSEGFTITGGTDLYAHIGCDDMDPLQAYNFSLIKSILSDTLVDKTFEMELGDVIIYPNPLYNSFINIQFDLQVESDFRVQVYDFFGKLVKEQHFESTYPAGCHKVLVNLADLTKGSYVIRTISKAGVKSIKMIKH